MHSESQLNPIEHESLLAAARSGNSEALTTLLNADRVYLSLVAGAELDSDLSVKASESDLIQESLLEAHQSMAEFRGTSQQQWLKRILQNNIKDLRRRYVEAGKRDIRREHASENEAARREADSDISPSQRALRNEQIQELLARMDRLPGHFQSVLRMRYWHQMSFQEIAVELESTAEAVRKTLYRAVESLANGITVDEKN